ncbi:glycoside hydrolase family 3 C-terminal domain-containing protein [Mollicutes bacterium LVI A0039]|nr:glycoside hydrolase family 3 C-terminal domain-containing protein [Mollicutes bacterium LVI A0039]
MDNYQKYNNIIEKMSIEEKIRMLSGANFWNTETIEHLDIPSMMLTDGPHGLRKQGGKSDHLGLNASIPATCFPTAAALANSWDQNLAIEMGNYLGREAIKEQVSVLLGPGLNIKRNPLCGRNFEYFSEDPFLSGHMAAGLIRGIEDMGISSCPKHFAVNSQEKLRMTIDEVTDIRALHEIYLEGFRIALKQQPKAIMTSYNKVNGHYANESEYLIKDTLKKRFGFDGLIVTDWGGNNDRVEALKVGNQLEMPSSGGITDVELLEAYNCGAINIGLIDNAVADILDIVYTTRQGIDNNIEACHRDYDIDIHHAKAIEVAEQSIVMLKNEVLPLKMHTKIGLVGDFAFKPRYQGAGSSLIEPTKIDSAVNIFKQGQYAVVGCERGFKRYGQKSNRLLRKAKKLASQSEYVLFYMGLDESSETEGLDRHHMRVMKNQVDVLKQLHEVNPNIIIILSGGAPIELDFEQYSLAILHSYLGGQGVNKAIYNIVSGKVNPSGKLAETYPLKWEDVLSSKYYPGNETSAEHRESIYVGYRYFETAKKAVRYPFGFGLSYTTFKYSNLHITSTGVTFDLTNTGDVFGREIAQMYVSANQSKIFRSSVELKGFAKVALEPGETKTVSIGFDEHTFSYFNTQTDDWEQEIGKYTIKIASNIKAVHLCGEVELVTSDATAGQIIVDRFVETSDLYDRHKLSDYYDLSRGEIERDQFELLYGHPLPPNTWDRSQSLQLGDVIAQSEYQGVLGKAIYKMLIFTNKLLLKLEQPIIANYVYFLVYMPWRQVSRFTGGKIKETTVKKLLEKL